jgi:hypothetical protein
MMSPALVGAHLGRAALDRGHQVWVGHIRDRQGDPLAWLLNIRSWTVILLDGAGLAVLARPCHAQFVARAESHEVPADDIFETAEVRVVGGDGQH